MADSKVKKIEHVLEQVGYRVSKHHVGDPLWQEHREPIWACVKCARSDKQYFPKERRGMRMVITHPDLQFPPEK